MKKAGALLVFLAACVLHREPARDGQVACNTPGDCPQSALCQLRVSLCFASLDDTAPSLLSVSATSPNTVVLGVSEALAPFVPDSVKISETSSGTALQILSATTSTDGLTVLLSTTTQLAGVSYDVDVSAVRDLQGNAFVVTSRFFGSGGSADPSPPVVLLPLSGARVITGEPPTPVTLLWTARSGASDYTVDISQQSDFAVILSTLHAPRDNPSVQVTPASASTYYWRVRADTTEPGQYGAGLFGTIADTLYVSCPQGGDCGASGEVGNPSAPYRSVARAIDFAETHHIPNIAVAARGGEGAYEDVLFLHTGRHIRGGYDSTFSEGTRSPTANVTRIHAVDRALSVASTSGDTLIEGMYLSAGGQVAFVDTSNGAVTFSQCAIESDPGARVAYGLIASGQGHATTLKGTRIHVRSATQEGFGLYVNGEVHVESASTIVVDPTDASGVSLAAVVNLDATLHATDSVFASSPGGPQGVIIAVGSIDLDRVTVAAMGTGAAISAYSIAEPTTANVAHARITSANGSGLFSVGDVSVSLTDSLVVTNAPTRDAVELSGLGSHRLTHNTLVGGPAGTALFMNKGTLVATNNIIVCSGGGSTGVFESDGSGDPSSFQGNTIVGCTVPYEDETGSLTTAADIDLLDGTVVGVAGCGTCDHARYDHTIVTSQPLFDAGIGIAAPFLPTGLALTGRSTLASDCGSVEHPVDCGHVTDDYALNPRASPPTRGAREVAP